MKGAMDKALEIPEKYAIGQPVSRDEDPRLLRGEGRYIDDISLPGQAYGVFLRSPVGHGEIKSLDISDAAKSPGVIGVVTAKDLEAAGIQPIAFASPLKNAKGEAPIAPARHALARDRVRHVGDAVALVVAETRLQALDAAEKIVLDIEALPAVPNIEAALAPGAAQIWPEAAGNIAFEWQGGDREGADRAFAAADHVTRLKLVNNRVVVASMETRGAIAAYDSDTQHFTLHSPSQGVFALRNGLAKILGIEPKALHVVTDDVGGSFGMKGSPSPELVTLLHAARSFARPVKWRDDRSEAFTTDHHGRDMLFDAELALDADGRFVAVRVKVKANMGAYMGSIGPLMGSVNILKNVSSLYRTPSVGVESTAVFTNTTFVGSYRGAGRPDGNYIMERLIDAAARETGRDPIELRRKNMLAPQDMPFKAASGLSYDSGDFERVMDACLEKADWAGFEARKAKSAAKGKLRGRGVASYLEVTAPPNKEMGGIRFEDDGTVSVITGTQDYGQGIRMGFRQLMANRLGVPWDKVTVILGDSDELIAGGGSGGSRSTQASGSALVAASDEVVKKGKQAAAHVLEAAVQDIEFEAGTFRISGTDRMIGLLDLAARLRGANDLPDGVPGDIDASLIHDDPPSGFPNGSHIVEVEIDPETGQVGIESYTAVNDFGTIINPLLVAGQAHGGIVQGIGQVLTENVVYDEDGQLLTGSFMDYAMPRADDVSSIAFEAIEVPSKTNPLGVKGCGEAGTTGALPAVMNAVMDALAQAGVTEFDMPATPLRVWQAIRAAKSKS
jgi:aerobic carbon-monoxide dehydrogenase large subunit